MIIAIGSDHAGFKLKQLFIEFLKNNNYEINDVGTFSEESTDYPDYGKKVAELVSLDKAERGILICGTGIGMSITANRYKNVRATLVHNLFTAEMSRKHNNSNLLCIGAKIVDEESAKNILGKWLTVEFEGGRHQRRLDKIDLLSQ